MADEFERHLKAALAAPDRLPDRKFVLRVQAAIALEKGLARQRAALLGDLAKQIVGVGAVAAGIWCVSRAAPVAAWLAQSPAVALAILLTGFAFLVAILGRPNAGATLIKLNGS